MKIAYCFYGQSRTFLKCYQNFFKNLFIDNSDIFLHCWTDSKDEEEKLLEIYQPKNFLFEKQPDFSYCNERFTSFNEYFPNNAPCPPVNQCAQLLSAKKSFLCLTEYEEKNNINYDFIVRTRYDVLYEDFINIKKMLLENKEKIFTLDGSYWNKQYGVHHDYLIFSNKKNMSTIMNIFDDLERYENKKIYFAPEFLIHECVKENNLQYYPFYTNVFVCRKNELEKLCIYSKNK